MSLREEIKVNLDQSDCLIIKGDCRKVLPLLPEKSVDLTVTDPPHASLEKHRKLGTTTRLKKSKSSSNPWFEVFPNEDYHTLFALPLFDAHKNNTHLYMFCDSETECILLTGFNPYDKEPSRIGGGCIVAEFGWKAWPTLTWVKVKQSYQRCMDLETKSIKQAEEAIRTGMGYHWRQSSQRIVFLEKGKRALNNKAWSNVLCGPIGRRDEYPTQKPKSVIRKLILNSSDPGDLICDPFSGSGVSGLVAIEEGRKAILIDINIDYMINKTQWPKKKNVVWMEADSE